MRIKKVLFYACIAATFTSCSKIYDIIKPHDHGQGSGGNQTTSNYSITEDFENGSKRAYAADSVNLSTGSWYFDDALLGSLSGDVKDGNQCVRLRDGSIAMGFDIDSLKMLYISHAKYGHDGNSTWQLLMSTDGGVTYTQVGNDINETGSTLVTDSFSINANGPVRFKIAKTGSDRIDLDDITFKGTGDPGITVGTPDTPPVDSSYSSDPSAARDVTVGSDAPPSSGDNSDLLFGNPSGAQHSMIYKDNYLIDDGYYTESYSASRAEPNWVSWHLDATNITHAVGRQDDFAAWSGLPSGWFQVQSNSYSGSGFDRGHNCPSADRTSSKNANDATFLMTNMIPQAPNNNQHTWADLENYLREKVVEGNEVYIIMGSYGQGGTGSNGSATTIDNGNITVPAHVWKVAVIMPKGDSDISRVTANTRVLAVNTPNTNNINSDWKQYIVSVRDIENATGYNLLSNLPQSVQDAVETKKDAGN